VRRELWEYRSLYLAPLIVAVIAFAGFMVATLGRGLATPDLALRRKILEGPFDFVSGVIMAVAFAVGIFYCVDAMQGERRDRSILFWKSLPVSDTTTVLAKLSIPLVFVPLYSFAVVLVTQVLMMLLSSVVLVGSGLSAAGMWKPFWMDMAMLLYHLLTIHVLWHAPLYSWLLLISASVRRMPIVWAVLPPFMIFALERLLFSTRHFLDELTYRLAGPTELDYSPSADNLMANVSHFNPGSFLATPGLWTGLVFATICIAGTVRIRRYRQPN
jgi:ABC-2 type transport system permease protein